MKKPPPCFEKQNWFLSSAFVLICFLLGPVPTQALELPAEIPSVSSLVLKTSYPQKSWNLIQPNFDSRKPSSLFSGKISSQILQVQSDFSEWRGSYRPFESLKFFQAVTYWHDVGFRPTTSPMVMDIAYGTNFSCGAKFYAMKSEKSFAGLLVRGKLLNATAVSSYNTKASMAFRAGLFFEHQLESKKILASLTHEHLRPEGSNLIQRNSFINFGFTWGDR